MTKGTTVRYTRPDGTRVAWHILAVEQGRAWIRWRGEGLGAGQWTYGTKTVECLRKLVKEGAATLSRTDE